MLHFGKNLSVNFDVFHEVQSDILAYPYAQYWVLLELLMVVYYL